MARRARGSPTALSRSDHAMRSLLSLLCRRWYLFLAGFVALVAVGGAVAYNSFKEPGDVTNENAEFEDTEEKAPPPPAKKKKAETFVWPQFGYTQARTRFLNVNLTTNLRRKWRFRGGHLLE